MKKYVTIIFLFLIISTPIYSQQSDDNIDNIIKNLSSDYLDDREQALKELLALSADNYDNVIKNISNMDHRVREAVLIYAQKTKGADSFEFLLNSTNDPEPTVRQLAINLVSSMPDSEELRKKIPEIYKILSNKNLSVSSIIKLAAVKNISFIVEEKHLSFLIELLDSNLTGNNYQLNNNVRNFLLLNLNHYRHKAIKPVIAMLKKSGNNYHMERTLTDFIVMQKEKAFDVLEPVWIELSLNTKHNMLGQLASINSEKTIDFFTNVVIKSPDARNLHSISNALLTISRNISRKAINTDKPYELFTKFYNATKDFINNPNDFISIKMNFAEVCTKTGKIEEAIKLYMEIINFDTENIYYENQAVRNLNNLLRQTKKLEPFIQEKLNGISTLENKLIDKYTKIIHLSMSLKKREEALRYYQLIESLGYKEIANALKTKYNF